MQNLFHVLLFHIKEQPFQILPFRMIYVHRMIRRLIESVENPHAASCLGRSGKYGQGKHFLLHHLGTAERKYEPSFGHFRYCGSIKPLISPQGIFQGAPVLGKGWRIDYYQVVLPFGNRFQIIYRITAQTLMASVAEAVQGDISFHQLHCLSGTVHGSHR